MLLLGAGVKKPILPFKEDQEDRCKRYDRQISNCCFQLEQFLTLINTNNNNNNNNSSLFI